MNFTINQELKPALKRAGWRFLKGAFAGAVGTMTLVIPANISNYNELAIWLHTLVIGGVVGFVTGGILALDKLYRDTK